MLSLFGQENYIFIRKMTGNGMSVAPCYRVFFKCNFSERYADDDKRRFKLSTSEKRIIFAICDGCLSSPQLQVISFFFLILRMFFRSSGPVFEPWPGSLCFVYWEDNFALTTQAAFFKARLSYKPKVSEYSYFNFVTFR